MKLSSNPFLNTTIHLITLIALAGTLMFMPTMSFAADKDAQEDRAEIRIKDLHTKLKITSEQEEQWVKVTQAMLEDAKTMDALTQKRMDHTKDMTAIDGLKSYSEIAEAHVNGIQKLIPVFEELYASMSDTQKKEADVLFQQGDRIPKNKKHSHKKPERK